MMTRAHFKCGECGSSFKRKSELINHESVHSTKRPFICAICNAGFKRNSSFVKHKHIHDKERYLHKFNKPSNKRPGKKSTNNRTSSRPEPGHGNEEPFKSLHCSADLTSTTPNQHIKPETHTTNSGTGLTNPGDVSTTSQLPSVSNQPSISGIHVNKSQDQENVKKWTMFLLIIICKPCLPPHHPGTQVIILVIARTMIFLSEPVNINKCVSGKCEINKEHDNPVRLVESEKDADLSLNPMFGDGESRNL